MRSLLSTSLFFATLLVSLPSFADGDPPGQPALGERRAPAVFAAGITTTAVGGSALVAGATMLFVGSGASIFRCDSLVASCKADSGLEWAGGITLGVGLVALAAGVPMIVFGGRRDARVTALVSPIPLARGGGLGVIGTF